MLRRLLIVALAVFSAYGADRTTPLPAAQVNTAYRVQLGFPVMAGDLYPFTFTYDKLPDWLKNGTNIDLEKGLIGGTPVQGDVGSGPITFNAIVTDAAGHRIGSFPFSIAVKATPTVLVVVAGTPRGSPATSVPGSSQSSATDDAIGPPKDPPSPTKPTKKPDSPVPSANSQAHQQSQKEMDPTNDPPPQTPPVNPQGPQAGLQTDGNIQPPSNQPPSPPDSAKDPAKTTAKTTAETPPKPPPPPNPPALNAPLIAGATKILGTADKSATVELIRSADSSYAYRTANAATGIFQFTLEGTPLQAGETLALRQTTANGISDFLRPIVTPFYRNGEELRAVLGYQQAGASAAPFTQNWFVDLYISRPLAFLKRENDLSPPMFRWWGNVRVASFPQAGDVPVATFATNLVDQFGQLKVNQLVQSAEFLTGFEVKLLSGKFPFLGRSEETRQLFTLGLIGGLGATGPMDPSSSVHVFEVPAAGSAQLPVFQKRFPGVTSQFVGFVSPDRDNFLRQYLLGLRLTTRYVDKDTLAPLISPPAMLGISVGQNEVVTGGKLHGVVLRTEAFYPLPFFNRSEDRKGMLGAIYLFGTAQLHVGNKLNQVDPVILKPRPDINAFDPGVTIVSSPNNRDVYHLGIGIDLVHAINTLTHPSPVKTNTPGSQQNTNPPQPGGANGSADSSSSANPK